MKFLKGFGIAIVLLLLYLMFWPVEIDPASWTPQKDKGLVGAFSPNELLSDAIVFGEDDGIGPEDIDLDRQGRIYASYEDGRILRYDSNGKNSELFVDTGGRPLGLEFDLSGNLIICDAIKGLLSASPEGELTTLLTEVDNIPLNFTDDVDVGQNGLIYFSDASTRWGIKKYRDDIVEHRPYGRLISYDPITYETNVLLEDLYFANGVAISPDQSFILVNETSEYRIQKVWITGKELGQSEILMENMPGIPDGISSSGRGIYWVAFPSLRKSIIDNMADKPFIRKMIMRLPESLQPAPERYGFIIGIDGEGSVIYNLQDPNPDSFSPITSVEEHDGFLYLASLTYKGFGRIKAPD